MTTSIAYGKVVSWSSQSCKVNSSNICLLYRHPQGRIEHPRSPDYLGLMIGTWVSLWLDFATIAIFDPIKPVYGQILPFYSF